MTDMKNFVIKVAGINVGISTQSTGTYGYCISYLTDETPEVHVSVTQADVDDLFSSSLIAQQYDNPAYLESIAVYVKIIEALLDYNCFMMHGAVVAIGNEAWMFSANSGTGKTTHIKQWIRNIDGAYVVNGDKPIIRIVNDQIYVCGTPWYGKERLGTNTMVPLKGIAFLKRNESNCIREMPFSEAYLSLLQHVHVPHDPDQAKKTLRLLQQLDSKVSYYDFKVNNFKDDCLQVAYNAMVGKRE